MIRKTLHENAQITRFIIGIVKNFKEHLSEKHYKIVYGCKVQDFLCTYRGLIWNESVTVNGVKTFHDIGLNKGNLNFHKTYLPVTRKVSSRE